MKVAINSTWGGFSLSEKAVRRMAELGHKEALEEVSDYEARVKNPDDFEQKHGVRFYGFTSRSNDEGRSDPILIKVIEELGKEANGEHSELKVVEIPDGTAYEIEGYDGWEHISERHARWG